MRPAFREIRVGRAILNERAPTPWRLSARLAEVCKILRHRYGEPFEWSDDADLILVPLSHCVVAANREQGRFITSDRLIDYLSGWCPSAPTLELKAIATEATERRRNFTSADLGDALALTPEEREVLGLRHIRFRDGRGKVWEEFQKRRARKKSERARRRKGVEKRADYLAKTSTTAVLAKLYGVSGQTIRNWRKAGWNPESGTRFEGSVTDYKSKPLTVTDPQNQSAVAAGASNRAADDSRSDRGLTFAALRLAVARGDIMTLGRKEKAAVASLGTLGRAAISWAGPQQTRHRA